MLLLCDRDIVKSSTNSLQHSPLLQPKNGELKSQNGMLIHQDLGQSPTLMKNLGQVREIVFSLVACCGLNIFFSNNSSGCSA